MQQETDLLTKVEGRVEAVLWSSRLVVIPAVVASIVAGFSVFFISTVDVFYAIVHLSEYASAATTEQARAAMHNSSIKHIVGMIDGYLLGGVLLIFAFGLYELFISDIDQARKSGAASRILVIESLDDLKGKLAKVILIILIVTLFEQALSLKIGGPLDLLYLGGSIALVGLALFLSSAAESQGSHGRNDAG
jgi:uncharacterized membrane protein YqhA